MENSAIPEPIEGKTVFQISASMRVRFNGDGWVEEIGKGGPEDPLGTRLSGHSGSKLDDIFARRYYDLYSRVILIDIHPKRETDKSGASGLLLFRDLEPGSPMHKRVSKIIEIGNHHFELGIAPLA
jgi:hypothetical protein